MRVREFESSILRNDCCIIFFVFVLFFALQGNVRCLSRAPPAWAARLTQSTPDLCSRRSWPQPSSCCPRCLLPMHNLKKKWTLLCWCSPELWLWTRMARVSKKKKKFVSVCEKNNVAAFFRCHNKSQLFAMWFFVKPNGKKEIWRPLMKKKKSFKASGEGNLMVTVILWGWSAWDKRLCC